jgi:ATP-binding cassette subfamily C protein
MKTDITNTWQKTNKELARTTTSLAIRSSVVTNITKSFRLLIQMAVMAVGATLVIKAKMSAGGIIATSILTGKALAPFDNAAMIYKALINCRKSYSRLVENLKAHENKEEKMQLPEPKGEINLEKLFYQVPNANQVIIKGINITINPGEIIGVIGPSGSGKTTLARLMVDVITPTKGSVRFDGNDLKNQDSEEIGKYIGYLPQDIELFDGSIKENIGRMKEDIDPQEVVKAANFAGIHDLILKLPKGYESNAMSLSAGQRQRIALARSFFGNPKFVILDEPNSNLDNNGEISLIKTIKNAKEAKITTIIVSHRPSILNSVDKILVLQDGEAKIFDEAKKVIKQLSSGGKS